MVGERLPKRNKILSSKAYGAERKAGQAIMGRKIERKKENII
jgi:hypothetical protein